MKVDAATRQLEGIIDCLLTHQQKSPRLSPWVQFLGRLLNVYESMLFQKCMTAKLSVLSPALNRSPCLDHPKDHLLMAPEIEVSGLAVYAMEAALDVSECIMAYAVLVAGAPQNVPWICSSIPSGPW